jgi:hypothetical protein
MLRIIVTFIIIYLIFRVVTRYVFPWLLKWYLARFRRKFYEQNPHLRQDEPDYGKSSSSRSKMKITIDPKDTKSNIDDSIGEYVDFEEVKEKNKEK